MANFITILRTALVFVVVGILYFWNNEPIAYWIAFFMAIMVIYMDGLDGYVARKFNLTSKLGAVLDIIGDRVVENVFWVCFLGLGWIPIWVPLVVVTRGIIVDGIRSVALTHGMTAFGKTTMMKSKFGKFLVASNFSRFSYAIFKAIAFSLLIIIHLPNWETSVLKDTLTMLTYASVYITVFFCVVRGLPVLVEGKQLLVDADQPMELPAEKMAVKTN